MGMRRTILAGFAAALAHAALAQTAALPATYTGPWRDALPPDGWTFSGLGAPDYLPGFDGFGDGAAKLDGTGDYISVRFAAPPESVSFWIQGFSFSGGVFRVEQSIDGTNWWALAAYAELPATPVSQTLFPALAARHLRFIYTERVTGNVGLDGVSVQALRRPEIGQFEVAGGSALVAVVETRAGRTYALERTASLAANPVVWIEADAAIADSDPLVLADPGVANAAVGFYRVRDATP